MVIGKITKQQRRDERVKLGKLEDLVVKPGTLQKYHQHFNRFMDWAVQNEFSLTNPLQIDTAASQFLEALWSDGFGRSEASYMLAALQFMVPTLRHALPLSWRLMKAWTKHELPTRAVPLDPTTVLSLAGLFWFWKEPRLAAGILVAFDFFLRTGELFLIRRQDVEFFPGAASLQLLQTKSSSFRTAPLLELPGSSCPGFSLSWSSTWGAPSVCFGSSLPHFVAQGRAIPRALRLVHPTLQPSSRWSN